MARFQSKILGGLLLALVVFYFVVASPVGATQGINRQIGYQGFLKTTTGEAVPDGDYDIVLNIYDIESGGTPLWTGTYSSANGNPVTIDNGFFHVLLGSGIGNTMTVDFTQDEYYLGITVGADDEMTPRHRIGASGYAFNSHNLSGYALSDLPLSGDITGTLSTATIAADVIDSLKILDDSILDADISNSAAVSWLKISKSGAKLSDLDAPDYAGNAGKALAVDGSGGLSWVDIENPIAAGLTTQFFRGDKTWAALDTSVVPENGNLYYTDELTRNALTVTGPLEYNSSNGQFSLSQATTTAAGYLSALDWNTFNSKLGTSLGDGLIWIGNASNIAISVALSGDATISNAGVFTISNEAITLAKLAANAVNSAKIVDGSIVLADIADGSVDSAKIVNATITDADVSLTAAILYSKLALGNSIVLSDLTADSVNNSKIVDGSIIAADLASDAVTSGKILDGTITNADVSTTAAIALSKLSSGTGGQIIVANASGVPVYIALSGDAVIDNTGALTIANLAVTSGKLADGAVTSAKIADETIATSDVADSVITYSKLQNVSANKLLGNATGVTATSSEIGLGSGLQFTSGNLGIASSVVTSLAAPTGSNTNSGSIASNILTLSFADATNPGLVSTGAQTFAGNKTFNGALTFNNSAVSIPNNLNFDSNTLFIDANNNRVGIGTTTPTSRLHIEGPGLTTLLISGNTGGSPIATAALLEIKTNNSYRARGMIYTAANATDIWFNGVPYASQNGYSISYDPTGAAVEQLTSSKLFINTSGNVGIGTATPSAKLHIVPSTAAALQIDAFGASAGNTGEVRFSELAVNGADYVGFKAPNNISASVLWSLPNSDGTAGQVLTTDGAKALSWGSYISNIIASGKIIVGNNSNIATAVSLSGDAILDNTGALTIQNSAVTLLKMSDNSVNSTKIVDDSIANADINASAAIALSKLANGLNIITSLDAPSGSNANGGSIASNVLTLSLADATNPGFVSTGTQIFAGNKTFNGALTFNNSTVSTPNNLNFDSNTLFVDANNNRIGMGTAAPSQKLHIVDNVGSANMLISGKSGGAGTGSGIFFHHDDSPGVARYKTKILAVGDGYYGKSDLYFVLDNTNNDSHADIASDTKMVITKTGNVGIGTAAPTFQLQLSTNSAAKPTSNTWTISSDERIKKDVVDFKDGLSTVLAIRPVEYKYNGLGGVGYDDADTHIGIIAQELEFVAPYMVETREGILGETKVDDFKYYQGHALPFILINAIKEQQLQIDELTGKTSLAFVTSPDALFATDANVDAAASESGDTTLISDIVGFIKAKIASGAKIARELVAERIISARGYFTQIFAKEATTEKLCVGTPDNKTCITKNQLDALLSEPTPTPSSLPAIEPSPTNEVSSSTTSAEID